MILVNPIQINDARLLASSVAEPDAGEVEWVAGTYNANEEVISTTTHRVYRSVIDGNTSNPETDDGTNWVDIRATNRWRMFDKTIGSQSTGNDVAITLDPSTVFNTVAGLNITGAESINVTVTDPLDGEIYNKDIDMVDNGAVTDYYAYFFEPIVAIKEFALFDLPPYPNAEIGITITGTGVGVGEILTGRQVVLGVTQYGTSWKPSQFGLRERDDFGNYTVNIIATTDIMDYNVKILKSDFAFVRSVLTSLGSDPTLWSATTEGGDGTLVYGYYDNINVNFSSPSLYDTTISVQGLV